MVSSIQTSAQRALGQSSQSEVLVRVHDVSKKFCRDLKKGLWYGLCDVAKELLPFGSTNGTKDSAQGLGNPHSSALRPSEFWANQGISFELRRGECLGLIGRNGAGKTTLLKILNGLIKPDTGKIEMRGRIGAMIALGTGFNPILTGRENIYVNGSILGLTKEEIDTKIDAIIKFSEIGDFIDAPVQSYSSGMQVRLGFAVASSLEPDILIIDEVLAVGDTAFKVRCYNKIKELLPNTAVIFVSHSMFDICRICTEVMVLKSGTIAYHGDLEGGVHAYNLLNDEKSLSGDTGLVLHNEEAISNFSLDQLAITCKDLESELALDFAFESALDYGDVRIRLVFFDDSGFYVAEWDSQLHGLAYKIRIGKNAMSLRIAQIRLKAGAYRVALVVADIHNRGYIIDVDYGINIYIENKALSGAAYKI